EEAGAHKETETVRSLRERERAHIDGDQQTHTHTRMTTTRQQQKKTHARQSLAPAWVEQPEGPPPRRTAPAWSPRTGSSESPAGTGPEPGSLPSTVVITDTKAKNELMTHQHNEDTHLL